MDSDSKLRYTEELLDKYRDGKSRGMMPRAEYYETVDLLIGSSGATLAKNDPDTPKIFNLRRR